MFCCFGQRPLLFQLSTSIKRSGSVMLVTSQAEDRAVSAVPACPSFCMFLYRRSATFYTDPDPRWKIAVIPTRATNRHPICPQKKTFYPRTKFTHSDIHICCPKTNPEEDHGTKSAESLLQDITKYVGTSWTTSVNGREAAVLSAAHETLTERMMCVCVHAGPRTFIMSETWSQCVLGLMQHLLLAEVQQGLT